MSAVLYEIVRVETGERYVGITIKRPEQRFCQHVHAAFKKDSQTHVHRALRKHGLSAFVFRVLRTYDTQDEAKAAEVAEIAATSPAYNMTEGGDGVWGVVWSEESRRKASESAKRKPPVSEETRARMAAAQRASVAQAENRARMTAKTRGKPLSPEHRAKQSAKAIERYAQRPDLRELARKNSTGRTHSPETRAKQSAARKQWWNERKQKEGSQ